MDVQYKCSKCGVNLFMFQPPHKCPEWTESDEVDERSGMIPITGERIDLRKDDWYIDKNDCYQKGKDPKQLQLLNRIALHLDRIATHLERNH